jgi:uncharacterized protein with PQ loop repeat
MLFGTGDKYINTSARGNSMPGLHHIHKRKRFHEKLEPYPHENKWIKRLDEFLLFVAVVAPIMSIPQIFKIYSTKTAAGVSALSFGFFAFFNIPWIIYGIVHKEKPIVITYILWLICNTSIVVGTLLYS